MLLERYFEMLCTLFYHDLSKYHRLKNYGQTFFVNTDFFRFSDFSETAQAISTYILRCIALEIS